MLKRLFKKDPLEEPSQALYKEIVEQARQPAFYRDHGVPDSLDGRFDLVILHVFLVLHRLKQAETDSADLGQHLFDILFQDLDQCLREIGVGDTGVSIRIKRMVEGFYGRVQAYETALDGLDEPDQPDGAIKAALTRNLYGTVTPRPEHLRAMAGYLRREAASLMTQDATALARGEVRFGPPPAAGAVAND